MNIVTWSAIIISCYLPQQGGPHARYVLQNPVSQTQVPFPADEKRSRTPAQKKIDPHLLYALRCSKTKSDCASRPPDDLVKIDKKGRVRVDIRAKSNPKLLALVRKLGGNIINVFDQYHSIEALMPLSQLETLALSNDVKFIGLPAMPMTSKPPVKTNKL